MQRSFNSCNAELSKAFRRRYYLSGMPNCCVLCRNLSLFSPLPRLKHFKIWQRIDPGVTLAGVVKQFRKYLKYLYSWEHISPFNQVVFFHAPKKNVESRSLFAGWYILRSLRYSKWERVGNDLFTVWVFVLLTMAKQTCSVKENLGNRNGNLL